MFEGPIHDKWEVLTTAQPQTMGGLGKAIKGLVTQQIHPTDLVNQLHHSFNHIFQSCIAPDSPFGLANAHKSHFTLSLWQAFFAHLIFSTHHVDSPTLTHNKVTMSSIE